MGRSSNEVGAEVQTKLGRRSNEVGPKLERSWAEDRTKLGRSSSEFGSNFNFSRTLSEVGLNFKRSEIRVAKKPNALRIGAYIVLQVGKRQSILCERVMATFSEYKRQRIVSLWHDGRKAPTIATIDRSSSEVGPKFERSWTEVRAKLDRSSSEVGPKFERSWTEVGPKFERSFFLRSSLRSGNIFSVPTVRVIVFVFSDCTVISLSDDNHLLTIPTERGSNLAPMSTLSLRPMASLVHPLPLSQGQACSSSGQ